MKHNYNLDWIRVLAMVAILFDHYISSLGNNWLNNIGLQVGVGGVTLFFAISVLLFGYKWRKEDFKPFVPFVFLKRRCVRIFIPLWILILITIPLEYLLTGRLELQTITFNAVGLGWVRPFGISGHLWYITMLMMLYLCFVVISYIRIDKIKCCWWALALVLLLIGYVYGQTYLTTYSKAGPPLFLFAGALVFAKGNELMAFAKHHKKVLLMLALMIVGVSLYAYQLGWNESHKAMAIASAISAGFITFMALIANLNVEKVGKTLIWLSGISYEIYLVHQPLIEVCNAYISNKCLMLLVWIVVTFLFAILLNKVSSMVCARIKD